MLLNLITNAIDSMASDDGSRVLSIESEVQDGGGVIVSVADAGKGIGSQDVGRAQVRSDKVPFFENV